MTPFHSLIIAAFWLLNGLLDYRYLFRNESTGRWWWVAIDLAFAVINTIRFAAGDAPAAWFFWTMTALTAAYCLVVLMRVRSK